MAEFDLKETGGSLAIDGKYYNALDIEGFTRMMKDPSYCYKFYWLEAIVQLISENRCEATYDEIINEMIANAWYSVLEFHIHLSGIWGNEGSRDNLERAVVKLEKLSGLPANASKIEIRNAIAQFDRQLHAEKQALTLNVPYKALSGFANKAGERISLDSSAGRMMAYYNQLSASHILLPYTFGSETGLSRKLSFNDAWIQMIKDNTVNILGWIQCEKVKWLQNNNPEVPGLIYKLAPLDEKMRKLSHVRKLWDGILELCSVADVFTDKAIDKEKYDIDHFIPWSFVMNDELWNLMPMDSSLNSAKSNRLPDWNDFFIRFVGNQYIMYRMIHEKDGIRKLFHACYKDNLHSIWANRELYQSGNSDTEFYGILEKNMRPVYDSARRQGYDVWEKRLAN